MIKILLREEMKRYRERTGERITYEVLSEKTGLSVDTLQSLAARPSYNPRLSTIEKLCVALQTSPGRLLQLDTETGNE